jgi:tetratricopeptide (TPR) repeat protein
MRVFPWQRLSAAGAALAIALLGICRLAGADTRQGVLSMPEPSTTALLIDYFDEFLESRDVETFRRRVLSRYTEGTLARLALSGDEPSRRAAVLALGLVGSIQSNPIVGRALRDPDPIVRRLAQNALWAIWFRADSPQNNASLERIRLLNERHQLDDAVRAATQLIDRAPHFAEVYNQRAIAFFGMGRYAESAADCRLVIERNPFHIGALAGLGKCYLEMGRRSDALETFRKAFELQPFDDDLRQTIQVLESAEP